ncbi:hypothetical protein GCM10008967_07810 [Bacillus carboniphilus]|uniref:VanZ-like domain-containing protein n=1 Tax=Bacillus carboniphilus TaxID=86663 RepID=A0ABN0VXE8_9BACI
MKQVLRYLLIVSPYLYMGFIWVLSSLPHDAIVRVSDDEFDKLFKESLHLIEFGILYILAVVSLLMVDRLTPTTNRWAAIVAALYGVVDELHQATVPYRSFQVIDIVKDFIGVFVLFLFVKNTIFKHPPRQPGKLLLSLQLFLLKKKSRLR